MNILMLLQQGIEDPTGLGRCYPLAKELVKKGNEVTMLCLHRDFKHAAEKRFQKNGVDINYVGQSPVKELGGGFRIISCALSSTLKMTLRALSSKMDVVHVFKPQPMNGITGLAVKYLRGKTIYLDCDDYEYGLHIPVKHFRTKSFKFFEDNLPRFAKAITVNSHFLYQRNIELGFPEEKIVHVPNGVDTDRFEHTNQAKVEDIKQQYGIENKRVVLYVGTIEISTSHAFGLLMDAFDIVRKEIKDVVLMFVGGGRDIETLKEWTKTKDIDAVFTGRVDQDDVGCYIKVADLSIDPVYDDMTNAGRSPLKVFESMFCGVPVLTADVGDRREILENGKSGMLVEPTAEAMSAGIIEILQDEQLRKDLAKNASKHVEKYYWRNLVNDFMRVYEV